MTQCVICEKEFNMSKTSKFFISKDNKKHGSLLICEDCIEKVYGLKLKNDKSKAINSDDIPSSIELLNYLDRYIVSQNEAKKTLAVAVRNHYKRLHLNKSKETSTRVDKSNVLLMGESGTGKTALVKRIAEYIDVPLAIVDTASMTADGYMGSSVEEAVKSLYNKANGNVELAERGIIFFDELDKKRKKSNTGNNSDISGVDVQTSMLKMVEGTKVNVGKKVEINTENILFIAGGAFVDLKEIIQKRLVNKTIGFKKQEESNEVSMEDIYKNANSDDLIEFGLIPELVGRFPVLAYTKSLTKEDITKIMTDTDDSVIKQFRRLFELDEVKFTVDKKAVEHLAEEVLKNKTGARGIRKMLESVLRDTQFESETFKSKGVSKIHLTKGVKDDFIKVKFRYNKERYNENVQEKK